MKIDPMLWGDATVTYPDWKGTAALDERKTTDAFHRMIGLSFDDWHVIGIEIGGGESGHELNVIAIERQRVEERNLPELAADGPINAKSFKVHGVDPFEFLRAITHVFELRLRPRSLETAEIVVTELGDALLDE